MNEWMNKFCEGIIMKLIKHINICVHWENRPFSLKCWCHSETLEPRPILVCPEEGFLHASDSIARWFL